MTDIQPEELTVAATLVDDPSVSLLTPWLTEEHFTSPVCRAALTVARKAAATCSDLGTTASFVDTHIACRELGETRWWPAFIEIQGHGCVPELFQFYAAKLAPEYLRRQGEQAVVSGSQHLRAATDDASVRQALTGLAHRLLDVSADAEAAVDAETVADLLARPRREQDWLIPDLLERQDRVLVVAGEGSGKSTLARQVAAACARGLHPFAGGLTIPRPLRVLVVDLENPEGVQHRAWQRLTRCDPHSGHDGWQQRLHLWRRPGGIDLRLPRDAAQLEARAAACSPDLMVFGPLYKSYRAREDRANDAAGEAAAVLDRIRERHGCALWLETHAPLAHAGGKRDLRPVDAGLWLRWPEFGLALRQEDGFAGRRRLAVERFRGDRDRADWPDALYEGAADEWPWLGEWAAGGPGMRDMT